MEYAVQAKAWMDETQRLDWVEGFGSHGLLKKGTTYLLMDEFTSAQMTDKVRKVVYLCETGIDSSIGGYTSKLQTMDVRLNCPYRDEYQHQFKAFMVTSIMEKPNQ
jgi:hypothetical protein